MREGGHFSLFITRKPQLKHHNTRPILQENYINNNSALRTTQTHTKHNTKYVHRSNYECTKIKGWLTCTQMNEHLQDTVLIGKATHYWLLVSFAFVNSWLRFTFFAVGKSPLDITGYILSVSTVNTKYIFWILCRIIQSFDQIGAAVGADLHTFQVVW